MGSFEEFENEGLSHFYDQVLDQLKPGISLLLVHPALESAEMDQITLDHPNFGAKWRAEDAAYFTSEHCTQKLRENSIKLIDFRHPELLSLLGA